jgi:ATP-binding cassette subfamily F protein uup
LTAASPPQPKPGPAPASNKTRKLSFKEQRELDGLPERIAALEAELNAITGTLSDGRLFASDNPRALELTARSAQIDADLMAALERWEALGA